MILKNLISPHEDLVGRFAMGFLKGWGVRGVEDPQSSRFCSYDFF